jgi:hypothetical protein
MSGWTIWDAALFGVTAAVVWTVAEKALRALWPRRVRDDRARLEGEVDETSQRIVSLLADLEQRAERILARPEALRVEGARRATDLIATWLKTRSATWSVTADKVTTVTQRHACLTRADECASIADAVESGCVRDQAFAACRSMALTDGDLNAIEERILLSTTRTPDGGTTKDG